MPPSKPIQKTDTSTPLLRRVSRIQLNKSKSSYKDTSTFQLRHFTFFILSLPPTHLPIPLHLPHYHNLSTMLVLKLIESTTMDFRNLSFTLLLLSTTVMLYFRALLAHPIYIISTPESVQIAEPAPTDALAFLDEPVFKPLASHIADHPYPWRDKRPFQETNYALLMGAVQSLLEAEVDEGEDGVGLNEGHGQQDVVESNSSETYLLWVGDKDDEKGTCA
ncbi:uncharacterized protein AKAW2_11553S [Aspergillus luchuensis]|uniref:Uncharacterized protein n=1 Tax=Aspergillus kawachii TaxID=1069201 RepID=A0A7R7W175_ASPKA|nr:uncharacterized protein AKAW2_11553S [Aspergillus luchuensis]BCR94507.1 hypothetical protein AKAW2_11553S [Aspergillus luchuensis]